MADVAREGIAVFPGEFFELGVKFRGHGDGDGFLFLLTHNDHLSPSLRDIPLKVNKGISLNA